ncbi:transposase-like protein [Salinibacter ruber]|uniref:Mutator family transposase n=1 Tax=Salinibacter ruber TaxID=146919 RepID=A0A9X2V168_9BACT|nr:transposase [Salinibacter ruber]MCS3635950.1 transposase-like protein [Salinibacter ruber]MCS3639187.1 transposase-like protein [Salinibacter ruber]MCS3658242.1 transposase-like protein [Salinibacter ruber]MCS3666405.1 transposase-like protein [Salinibacter ruber]MCS3715290.1 transposase-like protein [Salinibacter ruber]
MTQIEVPFDEKTLREVLFGDKGVEVLLERVMNEMMEAELTEHIGARPSEQTDDRRGYRNGHYQRELTTRVGTLELEVPRDREGTFQTELFERYQRSEKALVLALMQMVIEGVSTRRVKDITTELCGREFSRQTVSNLTERLGEQVEAWAERSLEEEYPFLVLDAMQLKVRRQKAVRSTGTGFPSPGPQRRFSLPSRFSGTRFRFSRERPRRSLSYTSSRFCFCT